MIHFMLNDVLLGDGKTVFLTSITDHHLHDVSSSLLNEFTSEGHRVFLHLWIFLDAFKMTNLNLEKPWPPTAPVSLQQNLAAFFFLFLLWQNTLKNGQKCKQPFAQSDSNMTWLMENRRDCVTPIPVVAFKWRRITKWLSFGLQCHASRAS